MYRAVRQSLTYRNLGFLALALYAAIFAHGVVEAGTIMGTTLNAVFLAFGIGLIDRLPLLVAAGEDEAWYAAEYGAEGDLEGEYDDENEHEHGYDDGRYAPHPI